MYFGPRLGGAQFFDGKQALRSRKRERHSRRRGSPAAAAAYAPPTYAIKKGTYYRYYVSSSLVREAKGNRAGGWRIPAGDLEGLVINRLRNFFADPAALLDLAGAEAHFGSGQRQLIERGRQVAEELSTETPDKAKATLMALLCRMMIYSDRIEIALCRGRAAELLAGQSIDLAAQHQRSDPASHDVMT